MAEGYRILQQVESDATSPSLKRSVSFEVTHSVTHRDDQVAEHDAVMMRIKDRLWVMSKNLLQFKELGELHLSPVGSLLT